MKARDGSYHCTWCGDTLLNCIPATCSKACKQELVHDKRRRENANRRAAGYFAHYSSARYRSDPAYREYRKAVAKAYYHRTKAESEVCRPCNSSKGGRLT